MQNDMQTRTGDHEPYVGPAAWTGAEMTDDESWLMVFDLDDIKEIEAALDGVRRRGIAMADIGRDDFPLPRLASRLRDIRTELDFGRGFVLMRGLPLRRYGIEDAQIIFWGIGAHLGMAVSQNGAGELMGHVTTVDAAVNDPIKRGYMKPERAPFHTDTSDVVGLMCWRKAKRGGESYVASAMTVHNIMLEERPDLLDVLYQPFYFDKKGEEQPGDEPCYVQPVFTRHGEFVSARYSRGRINSSQRFESVPRLTPQQIEALDYLDAVVEREDVHLAMDFQVGDIQLLSNYAAFHSRNAYQDYAMAEERRHLFRLWLALDEGRPLPETFRDVYSGDLTPGRRGGIPPRPPAGVAA